MTPARARRGGAARGPRPPALAVTDRGRPRMALAFLRRVVRAALAHGGAPRMPVSLLLCDDREISAIHARHLGLRAPTDVISFAIDGTAELVVSTETARRCAQQRARAVDAEVALYVVHGLLHLCGYDDRDARARARMRAAERAVLATLGIDVDDVDA